MWQSPAWVLAIGVTLTAAILPAVVWPGEISWINDEPRLLARAYHANEARTLADRGLRGNFGISYGPAATQIYQLMLAVTHDPFTLARLRAGLCAGVTALGMLWLARTLRLNPWFAAALMLAPYLWVFQRILWDASFAIPIGTVALAAYASFLRHGGRVPFLLALFCATTMPFIHPQDLPMAAPILLHVFWRHPAALRRNIVGVLAVTAAILLLNFTYFMHLSAEISYYMAVGFPKTYPGHHSWAAAYLGPIGLDAPAEWALAKLGMPQPPPTLPGRHILGGHGFMGVGDGGFGPLVGLGKRGLYVIYPLLWAGIAIAAWRVVRPRGTSGAEEAELAFSPELDGGPAREPLGTPEADAQRAVGGIALAGVVFQMLMAGAARVPAEPQYFFGTFALHALLAWLAVDALARVRLSYVAVLAYGLPAAAVTFGMIRHYHRPPNPPTVMDPASAMPTLGDSVAVANALRRYPPNVTAVTDIDHYHRFPQALRTLRLLVPPAAGDAPVPRMPLLIRLRSRPGGSGVKVEIIEIESAADIPRAARPINIAPPPAGWEPGME